MAFPKNSFEEYNQTVELPETPVKYGEIREALWGIKDLLEKKEVRSLFVTAQWESRNFVSLTPQETTKLQATLNTLKSYLVKLEGIEGYRLEATDNRAGTSFSDITRDITSLLSLAGMAQWVVITLQSMKEEKQKKAYEIAKVQENLLLTLYFGCLAVSKAEIHL